jgi:hypothetical protein
MHGLPPEILPNSSTAGGVRAESHVAFVPVPHYVPVLERPVPETPPHTRRARSTPTPALKVVQYIQYVQYSVRSPIIRLWRKQAVQPDAQPSHLIFIPHKICAYKVTISQRLIGMNHYAASGQPPPMSADPFEQGISPDLIVVISPISSTLLRNTHDN